MQSKNLLYYGDNLEIVREHMEKESVDLVYLDPPFKSSQDYNVLFAEKNGSLSPEQIKAFKDTWRWDADAVWAYQHIVEAGGRVSEAMQGFRKLLGDNDMMAYLAMMAPRLVELNRVLKPTGSIYLHCSPTASHYLKLLMDAVFGPRCFRTEIIWKRSSAHSDTKQGRRQHGRIHDVILFYTKTDNWLWNPLHTPYDQEYLDQFYKYVEEGTGRRYRLDNLTGPGGARKGNPHYDVMGVIRYWRYSRNRMDQLIREGRIIQKMPGAVPAYKRYLDEMPGVPLQDVWTDLKPISSQARERLGYPTQKPESLLERIIETSSREGDLVLDPFCGCGTTVAVAQRLGRRWIGIDITHLAVTLMKYRLEHTFGESIREEFDVIGEPVSISGALALAKENPYQFEWWALGLVGARPTELKKGADRGIDGRLYFHDEGKDGKTKQIILSVKSGHVGVSHIRDLRGVVEREKVEIGVLVSMLPPTQSMRAEAAAAGTYYSSGWDRHYARIQILTVEDILSGTGIDYPPSRLTNVTFKKAPKAKKSSTHTTKNLKL